MEGHTCTCINFSFPGGTFGLVLCLFAKLQEWWDARKAAKEERVELKWLHVL